jgi:hypothetical protein
MKRYESLQPVQALRIGMAAVYLFKGQQGPLSLLEKNNNNWYFFFFNFLNVLQFWPHHSSQWDLLTIKKSSSWHIDIIAYLHEKIKWRKNKLLKDKDSINNVGGMN